MCLQGTVSVSCFPAEQILNLKGLSSPVPETHDKFVREKRRVFILKEIFRDSRSARQEKQDSFFQIVPLDYHSLSHSADFNKNFFSDSVRFMLYFCCERRKNTEKQHGNKSQKDNKHKHRSQKPFHIHSSPLYPFYYVKPSLLKMSSKTDFLKLVYVFADKVRGSIFKL